MANRYIIYKDASNEFNDTIHYISNTLHNPEGAMNLIQHFESRMESIMEFPYSYPIIESKRLEMDNLRKCKFDNYLIIYFVNEELDQIEVVRILYQRESYL